MKSMRKAALRTLLMSCCMAFPGAALAQDPADEETLEDIVITGEIQYRNRTDTVAPELVYDQQFFEQFEPLSVGDQLSRVPGVAFTSDIGERDAPQMRGLGEGFTQVLVNGRAIPGAGNDRTVFVDRIPAEIIDRIEIVRSPSADIDSQGIGGTINIILKDGMSLPPGVIARIGGIYDIDNEELNGLGALSFSGRTDDRRVAWSATMDYQTRYNVKVLDQQLFDDTSPGFGASDDGTDLFQPDGFTFPGPSTLAIEHQDQIDTRDSTDMSFNGDLTFALAPNHTLRLDAFVLSTEREETESGVLYAREDGVATANDDVSDEVWELDTIESQRQNIEQMSYGLSVLYEGQLSPSWSFESQARYANFTEDNIETSFEDDPPEPVEQVLIDSDDTELSIDGALTFNSDAFARSLGLASFEFEVGAALKNKTRDYSQQEFEDDNGDGDFDDPDDNVTPDSGIFEYEEDRFDAWIMAEFGITENLTVQLGVRSESTETEARIVGGASGSNSSDEINPSFHAQWTPWENGQFRVSYARTVRRPTLDQLVPFANSDSPEDDDETFGNPNLKQETSWGYDIGYEHRLGQRGVVGFNYFHRDVSDLISLVNTGVSTGVPGAFEYTYENTGDGEVSGWEVDISTPLSFMGLDETGFFANYTSLDSERIEPLTGITARFNAQPEYVYNFGVTQNLPSWNSSVGFSYRKQGMSESLFLGEVERQWYDANLEVFVEHRLSENVVLRIVGNNLLDADSIQAERNFDGDTAQEIVDNQIAGDVDEFEVERENSSPTVLFSIRAVF
ncbi:MAG: TonB-dependent receptor plug domain-containing protein [Terricaulis sp.]